MPAGVRERQNKTGKAAQRESIERDIYCKLDQCIDAGDDEGETAEIEDLIEQRNRARAEKDFAAADAIRWPVVQPDRDVRPFQSVLLDLGHRLGLPGIPEASETAAVARDLALIEQTGASVQFCRLSTTRAVRMVARARYDRSEERQVGKECRSRV